MLSFCTPEVWVDVDEEIVMKIKMEEWDKVVSRRGVGVLGTSQKSGEVRKITAPQLNFDPAHTPSTLTIDLSFLDILTHRQDAYSQDRAQEDPRVPLPRGCSRCEEGLREPAQRH